MFSLDTYKVAIETLLRAMDNNSIEIKSGTIRLAYSGRGMYGSTCLGVVLDEYDMETFKVEAIEDINRKIKEYKSGEVVDLLTDIKKSITHPSRDSMGLSEINYYTSIEVPDEYHNELDELHQSFVYED